MPLSPTPPAMIPNYVSVPNVLDRSDFPILINQLHNKAVFDAYNEAAPQYNSIVKVMNSQRAFERYLQIGAFLSAGMVDEGANIPVQTLAENFNTTIAPDLYASGYDITYELLQDDPDGVIAGTSAQADPKKLGRAMRVAMEKLAASIYKGAFAADVTAGNGANIYDGTALVNAGHPNTPTSTGTDVQSNLLTVALINANISAGSPSTATTTALTYNALVAANTLMRKQKDSKGESPIEARCKQLIVGPSNEFTAKSILVSSNFGTDFKNNNVVPQVEVVVNDYIPDDGRWFLRDTSIENALLVVRENLRFLMEKKPLPSKDYTCAALFRAAPGVKDWRGIVGATGA